MYVDRYCYPQEVLLEYFDTDNRNDNSHDTRGSDVGVTQSMPARLVRKSNLRLKELGWTRPPMPHFFQLSSEGVCLLFTDKRSILQMTLMLNGVPICIKQ